MKRFNELTPPLARSYDACDFGSATLLGGTSDGGGSGFPVIPDVGVSYYGCQMGSHCANGQKLEVVVPVSPQPVSSPTVSPVSSPTASEATPAPTPASEATPTPTSTPAAEEGAAVTVTTASGTPMWTVADYDPLLIGPLDTLVFNYGASHDVYEFHDESSYDACDFGSATLLGGTSDGGGDGFVVAPGDGLGTYWYGCQMGSHCAAGQKIEVHVAEPGSTSSYSSSSGEASSGECEACYSTEGLPACDAADDDVATECEIDRCPETAQLCYDQCVEEHGQEAVDDYLASGCGEYSYAYYDEPSGGWEEQGVGEDVDGAAGPGVLVAAVAVLGGAVGLYL